MRRRNRTHRFEGVAQVPGEIVAAAELAIDGGEAASDEVGLLAGLLADDNFGAIFNIVWATWAAQDQMLSKAVTRFSSPAFMTVTLVLTTISIRRNVKHHMHHKSCPKCNPKGVAK
jgi:hypothetical protein